MIDCNPNSQHVHNVWEIVINYSRQCGDRDHPGQTDALLVSSLRVLLAVRRVHGKLVEADGQGAAQILSLDANQLALLMQAWP